MASLYSAGYGGDNRAAGTQQFLTDTMDQQAPAEVSPYAQQAQRMTAAGGGRMAAPGQRKRRTQMGQAQQTFRDMQAQGIARPAPPAPEPVTQQMPVQQAGAQAGAQAEALNQQMMNFRQASGGAQPVLMSQPPVWQSGGDMPEAQAVPAQVAPYARPVLTAEGQQTPMQATPMAQAPMQGQQWMAAGQPQMAQVAAPPPAPAAPTTGAPAVGTMPRFTGDINAYIGEALNNPGGYSFDETKKLYERLGQNIDDDFANRERDLRNEMAARGLSDSSIYGGRSQDLNVGRRSAQQDLLQTLGSQQAQALFGQQTGFLDRLLGLRGQDQTAAYQQGQLGIQQGELNRGLMNDQDRLMLALLGVGDF